VTENIISIQNLSKSFGRNQVLNDISFDVKAGEIFAFLGANGSGKTTTIRSLLGIYQADKGTLLVNGQKYDQSQAGLLGYLPEERGLYTTSRALETLIYFGQIKGMSYADARTAAEKYLERVELADKAKAEIKSLSSGQQQKIQLGITIINNPQLLILDEPTKGLDPVNRSLLLDILLELNKQGSTILFSTHQMEEAERIADRLFMIKQGKQALYGNVEEVKRSFGDNTLTINFKGEFPLNDKLFSAKLVNHTAILTPKTGIDSEEILKYLIKDDNVVLTSFTLAAPSLNDIFIQVINSPDV
jgi:ABC-2 type transport system ATP-binding protein